MVDPSIGCMPQRGIAYQPGVKLRAEVAHNSGVLKERRVTDQV